MLQAGLLFLLRLKKLLPKKVVDFILFDKKNYRFGEMKGGGRVFYTLYIGSFFRCGGGRIKFPNLQTSIYHVF